MVRWQTLTAALVTSACGTGHGDGPTSPDAGYHGQLEVGTSVSSDGSGSGSGGASGSGSGATFPTTDVESGSVTSGYDASGATGADGMSDAPQTSDASVDGGSGTNREGGGTDATFSGDAAFGDGGANLPPLTVYIAGDSTVSVYTLDPNNPKSWAGWGQMLAPHYGAKVSVMDDAIGGRTARRFIQEGHLAAILNVIKAGDYLLVQFGTNDSNPTATYVLNGVTYPYYAAPDPDFKMYLQQYIDGAHAKAAIPVLVTPPPRNSAYCNGAHSLANYGQAMIDLGKADGVAVVDLGLKAYTYLTAICPKPVTGAQEMFFKVNPDGTIDGTHFQENGARMLATFVADGITEVGLGLSAYRIR
ncbi:MAG: GDSL-type esterase/lipase family protein [Myxococcota bacterium]|nr:GDSL-type esterase/lipase family protein [Myxococcota bacterium]